MGEEEKDAEWIESLRKEAERVVGVLDNLEKDSSRIIHQASKVRHEIEMLNELLELNSGERIEVKPSPVSVLGFHIVTTRKDHICCLCKNVIPKGSKARNKQHLYCHDEDCQKGYRSVLGYGGER